MNRHFGYVLLGLLGMLMSLPALAQAQAYRDDILFVSDRDGNPKIYAMRPNGSDVRRLIDYSDEDTSPAWSPDKTRIAFASRRDGNLDIYVMDSDGRNIRQLTRNHGTYNESPTWSPDGRQIAFVSDASGASDIFVVSLNGGTPRQITRSGAQDELLTPAWSPDGGRIAYVLNRGSDSSLQVIDLNGRELFRYPTENAEAVSPAWSGDGRLAFGVNGDGYADIIVLNVNLSDPNSIATINGALLRSLSWSPDDQQLVYVSGKSRSANLSTINVNGQGFQQLLSNEAIRMASWGALPRMAAARVEFGGSSGGGSSGGGNYGGDSDAGAGMASRLPPYNQRGVAPWGAVRLNNGRGITNGARQDDGNFQVEGYCGGDVWRNNFDWFCGSRRLDARDFDLICQRTYNNREAFAIRDGNNRIAAFNWRCYAFLDQPPRTSDIRTFAPPGAVRLNNGRGITNGARQDNGNFQVEGYCSGIWHDNVDWFCGSRRLTNDDFDLICQRTYNNREAFAVRDGNNSITAFNWRCYGFPAQPPPQPTAFVPPPMTGGRLCSNSPPPRLRIGDVGYVVYGYGPSNLNRHPRRARNNNVVVDIIPEGGSFIVVDGPVCGDGYTWWRVRHTRNNFLGWIAEGEGNIYWLDRY